MYNRRICAFGLLMLLVAVVTPAQQTAILPDSTRITLRSFDTASLAVYKLDKDFDYGQDPENASLLRVWWENLKQRIARYFRGGRSLVGNLLQYALILGALLLLFYHFFHVRATGFFSRRSRSAGPTVEVFKEKLKVDSLGMRIKSSEEAMDFRSAYRWLYIKLLATLQEKELIRTHRYKTNRDYTAEMEKSGFGASFTPLAEAFDYIWYGDYTIDRETFEYYRRQVEQLELQTD